MAHKLGGTSGGTAPFVFYYTTAASGVNVNNLNYITPGQGFNHSSTYGTKADLDTIMPLNGTLNKLYGILDIGGTLGSNETVGLQIRKNNVVQYTYNMQFNVASQTIALTGLGISVTAGDTIQICFNCPNWVTVPINPTFSCAIEVD